METKISTSDLNLYYGNNHALKNINLDHSVYRTVRLR